MTISGNTLESELFSDLKFAYDWEEGCSSCLANMQITTCSLNGNQIVAGQCMPINDEAYEVLNEVAYTYDEATSTYTIYSARGLKWVADVVNATTPYTATLFDNATVELANNIDLKNEEWIPIGDDRSQRTEFHGTFDGKGYTVKNVKITKKTDRDDENKSSYGLFGNLKGTVKNLTVENVSISGAPKFIGALVGRMNDGLIENCHVKNSSVECNNWTIGGLVGQLNNGKISKCSVEKTTITGSAAVSAIVGIALKEGERTIENCSVKECTIVQNGSFGGDYDKMFGAIVGALYSGTLTVNLNNCSVEETTTKGVASNALCGFVSEGDKLFINGYESVADGVSMKDGEYYISNANGFVWVEAQTDSYFANKTIKLANDIDMAGVAVKPIRIWNPEDKTVFDGQNYTISNMTISNSSTDNQALFNGTLNIKNVNVDNANVTGRGYVGVLGGTLYGSIENCHVTNSTVYGNYWQVGGLVGQYDAGTISKSSISNSCITGPSAVGALVGIFNENAVKIEESSVNTCEILQNYSFGGDYDSYFAVAVGLNSVSAAQFTKNALTNNKVKGADSDLFYAE